jgi:hypothetical protein
MRVDDNLLWLDAAAEGAPYPPVEELEAEADPADTES